MTISALLLLARVSSPSKRGTFAEAEADASPAGTCLRCGAKSRKFVFSQESQSYVHTVTVAYESQAQFSAGAPVICGGTVAAVGGPDSHRARLRAGVVVRAAPAGPMFQVHHVRLGRMISKRNGSWTGTALCGHAPQNVRFWIPVPSAVGDPADDCSVCLMMKGMGHADD